MSAPNPGFARLPEGARSFLGRPGERLENPSRILIVPGWHNSEPEHWQSLWETRLPGARRVAQGDWMFPRRQDWVDRLTDDILSSRGEQVVLVAHSLGCMAMAHLSPEAAACISGALLVAPADPERRGALADFAPVPYQRLPYRSILVASSNDPCCPVRLAGAYARAWGSEFVRLEDAGHINVASGFGEWPRGLQLLAQLGVDVGPANMPPRFNKDLNTACIRP
jgi:uncharacterized protein